MTAATVVYVAFGVSTLDLSWIPDDTSVVVVHNDHLLDLTSLGRPVLSLGDGTNRGFGSAVNLALPVVETPRLILCNPDTTLGPEHFAALTAAGGDEVVAIPLADEEGVATSTVNQYWNAASLVVTALRLGRLAPRGSRARTVASRAFGGWGRAHIQSLRCRPGRWPLSQRWASGAVLSLPTDAVRAVGGFDEKFFLYYEDADLQQRMARHDQQLELLLADVVSGVHQVGGSIQNEGHSKGKQVEGIRRESALRYARRQPGFAWRLAGLAVGTARRSRGC